MRVLSSTLLAVTFVPLGAATLEDTLSELKESLTYGKPSVFLRARNENVDSAAFTEEAHANTLRVALGYETKPFHGFALGAQFEGIYSLGGEQYNSGSNGQTTRPLIADVTESAELQQAYLKYAPSYVPGLTAIIGRQEINLENQRFIGAVGWRQDWQSFDAASLLWKPTQGFFKGADFYYAFLDDVHRITPETTALGDVDMSGHAFNLGYSVCKELRAVAYAYLLDFETSNNAAQALLLSQATQTLGLRAAGTWKVADPWSLLYAAEYAQQSDYGDNPNQVDADYLLLEAGGGYKALTLKLGYEILGGTASETGNKFTTPLATLHAFQGWADLFLTTPAAGVEDLYVWLAGPLPFSGLENFRVGAAYHDYSANDGSTHFGSEINLLLEYSVKIFDPRLFLGVKYASYQADEGENAVFPGTTTVNTDTDKVWLYTQYSF